MENYSQFEENNEIYAFVTKLTPLVIIYESRESTNPPRIMKDVKLKKNGNEKI